MKYIVCFLLSLSFILFITLPASAETGRGDLALGMNYPGINLKIFFSDKLSLEPRAQFETNILVAGLRCNYNFNPQAMIIFFTGLELDYVSFAGEESKGWGFANELFLGMEFFLMKNLSLQIDFGPALIFLDDSNSSFSVTGLEYIVNFGLNWYLGPKEIKRDF